MAEITSLSQLDLNGYYTYQDYLTWQFQERVELFKGMIAKMSPGPSRRHQEISGKVYLQFGNFLNGKMCQVFAAPFDVRLPVSKKKGQSDTVVQPDMVVICDQNKLDDQGVNGAPDIVIEILSPGNSRREMKDKFELYEASLVPEYWIIDPEHENVVIYRLDDKSQYVGSRPHVSGDILKSEVLSGFEMDISVVFGE